MSPETIMMLCGLGAALCLIVGVGWTIWDLGCEARGLNRFAQSMAAMKRDAEASGGNIKTEARAFRDVFKP